MTEKAKDRRRTGSAEDRQADPGQAHEASKASNAPYGTEEHMNEELAKQKEAESKPS